MFGNKENSNGMSSGSAAGSRNNLVRGTVIDGNIKSQNDIRIDGHVKGNVNCEAKLVIGPDGFIEGQIFCQNAVIEGHVEGDITVKESLKLEQNSKVNGKIMTAKLSIAPGAEFNGSCNIIKPNATNNHTEKVAEEA